MSSQKMAENAEPSKTIADETVVGKYAAAAEIANKVLKQVLEKCVDGASCREISEFGDNLITEECTKVFKKEKDIKRGIAFPTCVSVNNCVCHFSPILSEQDCTIKEGDVVKVDLGAHIDGYISVVAHTIVVGSSAENKVTGRKADVILAAYNACQAALRLLKPKSENYAITDVVQKMCKEYNCKPVEGMSSYQLDQFKIDGKKLIIQNPSETQRKEYEKTEIEEYEVYGLDVIASTGSGTAREMDAKVSVFKKTEEIYQLKLKASRTFYAEVGQRFGMIPFNLRYFEDEKKARMGIVECVNHKLLNPFPVLYEKQGEYTAQFKITVMVLPNGPSKITGLPFDESLYQSEYSVKSEELQTLLHASLKHKATKKRGKGGSKAVNSVSGKTQNTSGAENMQQQQEKMEVDETPA